MTKYGEASICATELVHKGTKPPDAWDEAVGRIFSESESSQRKSCPRNAYLGLCEYGVVRGVSSGTYTRSIENKRYAIKAVELIHALNQPSDIKSGHLWTEVLHALNADPRKKHNGQMDVVLSLSQNGLLCRCT